MRKKISKLQNAMQVRVAVRVRVRARARARARAGAQNPNPNPAHNPKQEFGERFNQEELIRQAKAGTYSNPNPNP